MATVGNGNCHTWIRNAHGDWSTTGLFYIIQKHGGWFYYRWWLFVGPYHQIPQKRNITRTKRKSAFGGIVNIATMFSAESQMPRIRQKCHWIQSKTAHRPEVDRAFRSTQPHVLQLCISIHEPFLRSCIQTVVTSRYTDAQQSDTWSGADGRQLANDRAAWLPWINTCDLKLFCLIR